MTELRRVQTLLYRTLGLIRRLGLPEDMEQAVVLVQRLISAMNQLRLAAIALQVASGPIGWALAAVSAVSAVWTGVEWADSAYDQMRGA